ncbi:MAG: fatty acid desaturase [Myxococcales bacterium]|nr:fatty acid desaturase [Myxococcales bacterium]
MVVGNGGGESDRSVSWPREALDVSEFTYTEAPEPHAVRRRTILAAHPSIRDLYGYDRFSIPPMLAAVALQLALAAWVSSWPQTGTSMVAAGLLALFVGSVLHHHSSMFIHEASHDNCAPTPAENRFWAMIANASQGLPAAMTFRKYHMRHHGHLGVVGVDADLPAAWEVASLPRTRFSKGLWVFFLFGFWVARGWERRTPLNRHEVINLIWILAVDALILATMGPVGLAWLLLSGLIGHSFHPVAAHFIHEHYVFEEGQETYSYYGVLNWVTYNVGYHVEHHDFPSVPGSRLPELHARIPQYYTPLVSHRSWTAVLVDFVVSTRMDWTRRIVRGHRLGGDTPYPATLREQALLTTLETVTPA